MTLGIETQGSRWQTWLKDIDQVTLSPKPPSSQMSVNFETLDFIVSQLDKDQVTFKIPVFNDEDLTFAKMIQNVISLMFCIYRLEILNHMLLEIL